MSWASSLGLRLTKFNKFKAHGEEDKIIKKLIKIKGKVNLEEVEDLESSTMCGSSYCAWCKLRHKHCECYRQQSGRETTYLTTKTGTQQNVKFADQMDGYDNVIESHADPTRKLQDTNDATLENFFSRPIKVHEEEWAVGSSLNFTINPWSLYFSNSRVGNRLTNFNLMRCNLHVKVLINGNGFQYGRMFAAYQPFPALDNMSITGGLIPEASVQLSQMPKIFLDPTTSSGGEMMLPFFYHENYIHIPDADWSTMGELHFRTLNALKHANGATDVVTISVLVWAEDVQLNVLTSVDTSTLTPQSGSEIDMANKEGVVSGPATAIAAAANALSAIPLIRPFATATELVATATAKTAKLFGYCRPTITRAPEPYRPTPTSSLALTNAPDNAQKLTVDDKQELTIDPKVAGLDHGDLLEIGSIASRESYFQTFDWTIGTAPETLLWNMRLQPVLWQEGGSPAGHWLTASGAAALPFKYWTGSMKIRFQIVCSSFHKGRIKIVYDPNFISTNEYNTNYLKIVDIADEQDFTIEIGNGQEHTLLEHYTPGVDSVTQLASTTPYAVKGAGNGVLGVYVVNELTTPNSVANNDIQINVFVSMGDDFEVFMPNNQVMAYTFKPQDGFESQSGTEIVPESQNTSEPSKPEQDEADTVGPSMSDLGYTNLVFTGESVKSFRTLLKRYALHTAIGSSSSSLNTVMIGTRHLMPYFRGAVPGAVDITSTPVSYSYCNTLMIHWVTSMFQGWRGAIRYKLVPRGAKDMRYQNCITVERCNDAVPTFSDFFSAVPPYSSSDTTREGTVYTTAPTNGQPLLGMEGAALTLSSVNNALEFEVPCYLRDRFFPGKNCNWTSNRPDDPAWRFRIENVGTTAVLNSVIDCYAAVGEDYQVYMFTGLPPIYYEATPPPGFP